MSDFLTHECGIAAVRLRKPLSYYYEKYGSALYGFNQLFLLMEKQHNRGQDGAGIGCVKIGTDAGKSFMDRERSTDANALAKIFKKQLKEFDRLKKKNILYPEFPQTIKDSFAFGGEVLMGHLRYGTSGDYQKAACHPYLRRSNWITKNLLLAGNFNITNKEELNEKLIARGQHPIFQTDTNTILEELGYHLDEEHTRIYRELRDRSEKSGQEIQDVISTQLDVASILRQATDDWDGGYAVMGAIGNGDFFVVRDPTGIRPCFYLENEEVFAVASERVPLMTIFNATADQVKELTPGAGIIVKSDNTISHEEIRPPKERKSCSFEHVYFSRGNDAAIYQSRKNLGGALVPDVMKAIDDDLHNSVFSFIPNTAEIGYYGMMDELRLRRREQVKKEILEASQNGSLDETKLDDLILNNWPRAEKIAHKDIKLRTFISQEKKRTQLASHVYDITYGVVHSDKDHLVVVDDSIVRGTTLRQSILKILSRTLPKSIVIASTAPQIRYPDCYGIDMSELGKFIAFDAAVQLLKESGASHVLHEVYQECIEALKEGENISTNPVKKIYENFTDTQISAKISEMVYPTGVDWSGKVTVIYQTVDNLHRCLPEGHHGDWYFTGNYPTPGGFKMISKAFINYYEKKEGRSY